MIRSALILIGILLLIAFGLGLSGEPGTMSLVWLGYRVDTSAMAAIIVIGVLTLLAVAFWNIVLWLTRSPQRAAQRREETRRRQGEEILTRGFLAVANGDGAEARRCAVKAIDVNDNVAMVRILSAMAAETADDATATKAAYQAMLSVPELKLAGLKGLMTHALQQNDKPEAYRIAAEAYNQPRPAMWSFKTLFESKLGSGEWAEALDLIEGALNRKLISPIYSDRAKASLMAASAAQLATSPETQMREQALDYAVRAAKLQPGFTPAALIAANLLNANKKLGRAEDLLEAAFASQPHPAIWMSYRDLVGGETPPERARRLQNLVDRNPKHLESRILELERALMTGQKAGIAAAMSALEPDLGDEVLTRRLCGLMARGCLAQRDNDGARAWVAKASLAKSEPAWSDIDEDGKAFNYSPQDWTTMVLTFAQNATLAHPRFERDLPTLPDLPDMASRYVPSMPFVKAAQKPAAFIPQPDDPGIYEAAITGQDLDLEQVAPKKTTRAKRTPKAVK